MMSRMIDDEEELKDYGLIEKCSNLVTDKNKCLDTWDDENADYKECKRINCYKKQLKRLQAENEKLKEQWNNAINENRLLRAALKNKNFVAIVEENEQLKKWLENKEKACKHLCNANNRKKEQIKNLNYMLFEEKEMITQEWKLKYRLANKERKFIQYKEITNKRLNNYKQALEDIREFINNSCKLCTAECDCVIDDEYCPNYVITEKINEVLK